MWRLRCGCLVISAGGITLARDDAGLAAVLVSRWSKGKYTSGLDAGNALRSLIAAELAAEREATIEQCVRTVEGARCKKTAIQQMRNRNKWL